ncbi:MAG: biotin transporter BioY, partial [Clostridiaceae bacterium]
GPQYVLYPTFGYLVGMLFGTTLIGYLSKKFGGKKIVPLFIFCFLGLLVVYTLGVFWLYMIKNSFMQASNLKLNDAIVKGALLFMVGDTLWCGVAAIIGSRINRITDSKYLNQ